MKGLLIHAQAGSPGFSPNFIALLSAKRDFEVWSNFGPTTWTTWNFRKKGVWLQYQFVLVIQTNCKHFYSFLGQYINSCGSTQMKCFIWVELNRSNFDFSDYGKMQYLRLWQNGQFCRCDFSVWGAPASLKWCIEVVLSIYFCHKAGTDSKFSQ